MRSGKVISDIIAIIFAIPTESLTQNELHEAENISS